MTLDIVADDDAQYTSGTNAPMANTPPPVTITVSKYRGRDRDRGVQAEAGRAQRRKA